MLFRTAGLYLVCCWSLGDVIQVAREDLTGYVSFFKVKKMFTFNNVHLYSQSERNSGNKQTLHFSFKNPIDKQVREDHRML